MKLFFNSRKSIIISFFIVLFVLCSALLSLPVCWVHYPRKLLDVFFTSMSAISVTGLSVFPMAELSMTGKIILLLFIQLGGLGIISLSTMYLLLTNQRLPSFQTQLVNDYFNPKQGEQNAGKMILYIIGSSILIELIGSFLLYFIFQIHHMNKSYLYCLFFAISGFCNAGFSYDDTSLSTWMHAPSSFAVLALLIIIGGIGFVVTQDIVSFLTKKTKRLRVHTKVTLFMTAGLLIIGIIVGVILELIFDDKNNKLTIATNAILVVINSRTAGFNFLPISQLSIPTLSLCLIWMFIGGGSGGTAGGIKVTTFYILIKTLTQDSLAHGNLRLKKHTIPVETIYQAIQILFRAITVLMLMTFLLSITETAYHKSFSFLQIFFEVTSALSTVGFSAGMTPHLSPLGKIIIILTMFIGRVGLLTFIITPPKRYIEKSYYGAKTEILLG